MKLIPLYGINGIGKFTKVDDEDYDFLTKWRWFCVYREKSRNYYVECNYNLGSGNWTHKKIHQLILGKKEGFVIDHIDGDGLNNQKSNLRHCLKSENSLNKRKYKNGSSKYAGVSSKNGKWVARIQINKKLIHLGYFKCELAASKAYNDASKIYFKDFERSNKYTSIVPVKTSTKKNEIKPINSGDGSMLIPLSKNKFAIISEEDYPLISKWKWSAKQGNPKTYYSAVRHLPRVKGEKRKSIRMHNQIMNPPKGLFVDHINRNPLDNRRENLRICTHKENCANRSTSIGLK